MGSTPPRIDSLRVLQTRSPHELQVPAHLLPRPAEQPALLPLTASGACAAGVRWCVRLRASILRAASATLLHCGFAVSAAWLVAVSARQGV